VRISLGFYFTFYCTALGSLEAVGTTPKFEMISCFLSSIREFRVTIEGFWAQFFSNSNKKNQVNLTQELS
jgi:hypothetical protein